MEKRYLVETDVFVDYLRDHQAATDFLEREGPEWMVSVVSVAELFAGCHNEEKERLQAFLEAFEIVPLNHEIAVRAGALKYRYAKSHGIGLADALIAATAELLHASLATLNQKHFPMLKTVVVPYKK